MILKKCKKCGALVKILKDCNCDNCGIKCCNEELTIIKPNEVDAAFEKHIPIYEVVGNNINVKVDHVMEEDHYIEWICYETKTKEEFVYFNPNEDPKATFKYEKDSTIYSYCNKHLLWMKKVD